MSKFGQLVKFQGILSHRHITLSQSGEFKSLGLSDGLIVVLLIKQFDELLSGKSTNIPSLGNDIPPGTGVLSEHISYTLDTTVAN